MKKFFAITILSFLLYGCSSQKAYIDRPLKDLYKEGMTHMKNSSFEEAADSFDEVERQHPYSLWAAKAQILSAYCAFKAQKFPRAVATLDVFISLHPSSRYIGYAYYLRALSYYTDLCTPHRDRENADLALQAFKDVLRRFPDTDYAHDARLKIDFLNEHLATQDMIIGRYYLENRDYIAAFTHLGEFVKTYPKSALMPEALYRLLECHKALGLLSLGHKTFALLNYNFPNSKWRALSKDLMYTASSNKIK